MSIIPKSGMFYPIPFAVPMNPNDLSAGGNLHEDAQDWLSQTGYADKEPFIPLGSTTDEFWVQKGGRRIRIVDMTDPHLDNTLAILERDIKNYQKSVDTLRSEKVRRMESALAEHKSKLKTKPPLAEPAGHRHFRESD